jgi:SAM-dependent methyltransferase
VNCVLRALRDQTDWQEVFERATHGHLPPVVDSLRASHEEGKEFLDQRITFAGSDVLDLGCGNGRQMVGLLDQQLNRYVGLDPVRESITFCDAELVPLVSGAEFVFLDVYNEMYNPNGVMQPESVVLPFPDESFDGVITGSVFTHLGTMPVSERYLAEISRVLRPGGRFFSSWFRNPPNQLSDDRLRTVFREGDILRMLTKHFELTDSRGGFMGEYHDQWCVFAQRR